MTLLIVSGLASESAIVEKYSGVKAIYGATEVSHIAAEVPSDCTGVISFGVCGGLSPSLVKGNLVVPSKVVTAESTFSADQAWGDRVVNALVGSLASEFDGSVLSNPNVWASDPTSRATLYKNSGCEIIDTESGAAASFAVANNLPFIVLRAISDASTDTVLNDPNEITSSGQANIFVGIRDLITHPKDIVHEAEGLGIAINTLRTVASKIGALGFLAL